MSVIHYRPQPFLLILTLQKSHIWKESKINTNLTEHAEKTAPFMILFFIIKCDVCRYLCSELRLLLSISQQSFKPRWMSIFICRHISLESRKPSFPTRSGSRCRDSILSHRISSAWDHSVPLSSSPAPRKMLGAKPYRQRDRWMDMMIESRY